MQFLCADSSVTKSSSRLSLGIRTVALLFLAQCTTFAVAGVCDTRMQVRAGETLNIQGPGTSSDVKLIVRLKQPLSTGVPAAQFGLDGVEPGPQVSARPARWRQTLLNSQIDFDNSSLTLSTASDGVIPTRIRGEFHGKAFVAEMPARGLPAAPSPHAEYRLVASPGTSLTVAPDGKVIVAPGSDLEVELEPFSSFTVTTGGPVTIMLTAPFGEEDGLRVAGHGYVPSGSLIKLELRSATADRRRDVIHFCVRYGTKDDASKYQEATVRSANAVERGMDFGIELPGEAFGERPWFDFAVWKSARVRAIARNSGTIVFDMQRDFTVSNPYAALWIAIGILTVVILCATAVSRASNPLRLAYDLIATTTGRLSLSNFQILIWTLLVAFALIYIWLLTGAPSDVPGGILALLGISGAAGVVGRVLDQRITNHELQPGEPKMQPALSNLVQWDGEFDLLRFQMLVFTLLSWAYAAHVIFRGYAFPEIPESLYTLMGISNVAYLGGKFRGRAGSAATAHESKSDFESTLTTEQIRSLQRELRCPVTGVIDRATRAAVEQYRATAGISPVIGRISPGLLKRLGI